MAFNFKKEYKEFYAPRNKPAIVDVPAMKYITVRGTGDPNIKGGEYQSSIEMLYAITYTIKMSKKGNRRIEGYFDFVVPPLEGFWWQEGINGFDQTRKDSFHWISCIRVPDFVTEDDLIWAKAEAARKKKLDCSKIELITIEEGLCVQIMHIGPYDDEPTSVALMDKLIAEESFEDDFSDTRLHHEIYLSDARRVAPEKRKTIIRHPIRKKAN